MPQCMICDDEVEDEEIKHLPLYVTGSEGLWACLKCRMTLTEVARGMMQSTTRAKLNIVKKYRKKLENID